MLHEVNAPAAIEPADIEFVLCVEANRLAQQARLLCESLRTFGGPYREAPIFAVSPRPALAPDAETRQALEDLGVTCVVAALNETQSSYGTINRVVAGAWAENAGNRPYLAVLDTDMLFVAEPTFSATAAGVRPVDIQGSATTGEDEALEGYWSRMCELGGISLARLPWLTTTIDRVRIRASYNGGFTVVRRELGILRRTREVFFAALAANLRPRPAQGLDVFASTGFVGREASEWWGASQAALAVGLWATTDDVHLYDDRYNVPLNNLGGVNASWPTSERFAPILLHYHHLAEAPFRPQMLQVLERIGCRPSAREWIADRLRLFDR